MRKLLIKFAVHILTKFADKWDIDLNKNQENDLLELAAKIQGKI